MVLLIPLLYAFDQLTLERLYAAVFLLAVVSTIFGPALSASVPQLVRRDQLTAANALLQTTTNTGLLIGPLISGVGIALIGSQNVLYVDAVTFFVSALCLIGIRMRPLETRRAENARGTWTQELLAGIRFVYLEQTVLVLMVTAALYSLAASAFAFMLPVFAEQNLSAGALEVGALWSALGAGMLATSTWLASLTQGDLHGRFTLIFRSMAVGGLAMCGLSMLTAPLIAGALILIIGGSTALFMPIVWGVLQEVTPAPLLGRVFTTFSTGSMASAMAGMAGFGWAADTMGPHVSLLGIGLVLLCTACIALLSCRRFSGRTSGTCSLATGHVGSKTGRMTPTGGSTHGFANAFSVRRVWRLCRPQVRSVRSDATVHDAPVHVGKKCIDVLPALRRGIVEQKGMFPHIHDEHRLETGHIAVFVQSDPMVAQPAGRWVLEADRPPDPAHLSDAHEVCFPPVVCAERRLDLCGERPRCCPA